MNIRLIALDIDDTIVDRTSIIPKRTLEDLRLAQKHQDECSLTRTMISSVFALWGILHGRF